MGDFPKNQVWDNTPNVSCSPCSREHTGKGFPYEVEEKRIEQIPLLNPPFVLEKRGNITINVDRSLSVRDQLRACKILWI
jgi:hypothetical protein